jgi:hypothetical protein
MRRIVFGSLSFFLLASMRSPALHAEMPSENIPDSPTFDAPSSPSEVPTLDAPTANGRITPFNLVRLAYQGFFENQGIPSGDSFLNAYQNKTITAEDIVKGAIAAQRLPSDVMNDSEYVAAVGSQLDGLTSSINKR